MPETALAGIMPAMTSPANLDQLTADELRALVRRQADVITLNDRELNWRQAKIDNQSQIAQECCR